MSYYPGTDTIERTISAQCDEYWPAEDCGVGTAAIGAVVRCDWSGDVDATSEDGFLFEWECPRCSSEGETEIDMTEDPNDDRI